MIRRALRSPFALLAFVLALAGLTAGRAAAQQADELPTDGHNALTTEMGKWTPVWSQLLSGQEVADPSNTQHTSAIDAAARWATYRMTWGLEKEPGEFSKVQHEFTDNLQLIRAGKDKTQKLAELYAKRSSPTHWKSCRRANRSRESTPPCSWRACRCGRPTRRTTTCCAA